MIKIDRSRDELLTAAGKATLSDRYLLPNESYQDLFARVAGAYGDDDAHCQRVYDYISRGWFMPATPILTNGGTTRGLPISCYLNEAEDSLRGIIDLWVENSWLAAKGGGIGSYWGNLRSLGERVHNSGKTGGVIPFMRVQDSLTLAISQGSIRRGSAAVYLPIWHPEIEEFVEIRKPTGGDPGRRCLNIHNGIVITDDFMQAVALGDMFELKSPKTYDTISRVDARSLWSKILTLRIETGEPYLIFIDRVNRAIPAHHKELNLNVKMSNLCTEITLPTGKDHKGQDRTAVCCLSSLNLELFDVWKGDSLFILDVMRFLDNVLDDFIKRAPPELSKATYSAARERSVGLGVMGFHSYLQSKSVPWESGLARATNIHMFQHIKKEVDAASITIATEKGACPDASDVGVMERFSNKTSIAPTASISIINGTSPGIEPYAANSFTQKTLSGSMTMRNRHLDIIIKHRLNTDSGPEYDALWSRISQSEGSIYNNVFFTQDEREIFKTAREIGQAWLIEFAADRQPYIDQAQSLNLFLPPNVHKQLLHDLHFSAWEKGLKSLYYLRSVSTQRAEKPMNFEEDACLGCQ